MAKVIIFGLLDTASLAHFYLKHDSDHQVVAFTVNEAYKPKNKQFEGLPVVSFEEIQRIYPPNEYQMFVPMTGRKMGKLRESVYIAAKNKGYNMISYISTKATVFQPDRIGDNCFILENNTIQPYVNIGNNVMLWSGNHIGHHSKIHDHVSFTSHVVLSGHCTVEPYCFLGVNSTVRDYIHLAEGTFVAMSGCVIKDTEPWGIYGGVPAKKFQGNSHDADILNS